MLPVAPEPHTELAQVARSLGPAVTLIRPMLEISRAEVMAYLASLAQPYREDSTNSELQFTRNRIRHELLPLVKRHYAPAVVDSLLRLGNLSQGFPKFVFKAGACLAPTNHYRTFFDH